MEKVILDMVFMVETGHLNIVKRTLRLVEEGSALYPEMRYSSCASNVIARYKRHEIREAEQELDGSAIRIFFKDGSARLFTV